MDDDNFLPKLSHNLLEILNDEEYYDITIEVEIFPIILRYIYGGRLSLKEYDTLDIINVMIAASELSLQELIVYLQSFLVKNKTNWMEQNFDFVYQTSFKNDSFLDLQKYYLLKTFLSLLDPDSKSSDKSRPRISSNQSQFNQMNEFEFFPLKTSEESIIASTKRNEIPTTSSIFGRAALGRTGSGSTLLLTSESSGHLDMVQRKVNALLNKLTLKNFESLSDQIIIYGNKSRGERDGRILREIIRLIFERSCNDSKFCAIYAYLCRKMMERVDPEIVDESIKNTDGKSVQGGTLFRKYLINHCQEDFEKGWKINIPSSSNESDLTSDKYYAAAKAKRKDSPKEEEMESLCILLNTVGKQLDHVKQKQIKKTKEKGMNSYFNRLEKISKLPSLSNRIKFMLMDIINLRKNDWNPQRNIDALINELTLGMIQL
ncbi:armadillo-type protein [Rhizophagus irregularis DAOM 181602=DAOM 197198]|nr:armadillo-type protein [Rhizophagus irregularis DAOM 181602=DAOM 197198]